MGPGKFVLGGLVLIVAGVGTFTFLGADSSYWLLCGALFVQGLGMGMTMMPIMSAAPSRRISAASCGVRMPPTANTGMFTACLTALKVSRFHTGVNGYLRAASHMPACSRTAR